MQLAFKHQLVLQKSTIHRQPQRQLASSRRTVCQAAPQGLAIQAPVTKKGPFKVALLFDCDGVIVDTEQLHRRACKSSCMPGLRCSALWLRLTSMSLN